MTPHRRPHRRAPIPQSLNPEGTETFDGGAGGGTLALDPSHTGINPSISVPALTITQSQSTTSVLPSADTSPSPPAAKSTLATGAIIGIAVGIFAILAVGLVSIMMLKHKKKMSQRSKAPVENTVIQMKEKQSRSPPDPAPGAPPPTVFRGNATSVGDDDSFLSLRSTNNGLQPLPPSQQLRALQSHQTPAPAIPNPFSSPTPSRTPSNATSSHHAPTSSAASIDPGTLASFPAVHYLSANPSPNHPHFSVSDYTDINPTSAVGVSPLEEPEPDFTNDYDEEDDLYTPIHRSAAPRPQARDPRARDLRAMQDLLSALDSGPSSAPSSWVGEGQDKGSSRLSRGEGLVTPIEVTNGSFDPRRGTTGRAYVPSSPTQTHPLKSQGKGRENPFEG